MNSTPIVITAWIAILLCICSMIVIAVDIIKHPQMMKIMNVVWPVTALYSGPLGIWAYFKIGRQMPKGNMEKNKQEKPVWQSILKGALHCGSGCTLGDLIAASLITVFAIEFFNSQLITDWTIEYIVAFVIGIIFQYYAIKPMKNLSAKDALIAALKADTLSLTFWQIGMYGWMAIANFLIFHRLLKASDPVFWFMMQIGMLCGLATAYPINWVLIKKGIKEAM